MDYYFNTKCEPFTCNAVTCDDAFAKGEATKKTGIADVEAWRLSLDSDGNVVVFGGAKNEADAQTEKETARTAEVTANKVKEDAIIAAQAD
jgi:hypothetical protein